eukprot:461561_1
MAATFMQCMIERIKILNMDQKNSTITAEMLLDCNFNADKQSFIVTDSDEELLILISFKTHIKLHSMKLYALLQDKHEYNVSAPGNIDFYIVNHAYINFEDLDTMKPDKSITCCSTVIAFNKHPKDTIAFNQVHHLAIHIKSNQLHTAKTLINKIVLKCEYVKKIDSVTQLSEVNNNQHKSTSTAEAVRSDEKTESIPICDYNDTYDPIQHLSDNTTTNTQQKHISTSTCESIFCDCPRIKNVAQILHESEQHQLMYGNNKYMYQFINNSFMNGKYDTLQFINDIQHAVITHKDEFDEICGYLQSFRSQYNRKDTQKSCTLQDCQRIRRNHRDRNDCKAEDLLIYEYDIKEMVTIHLIDSLHCFYFHTFDRGLRLTSQDSQHLSCYPEKQEDNLYNERLDRTTQLLQKRQKNAADYVPELNIRTNQYISPYAHISESKISGDTQYSFGYPWRYHGKAIKIGLKSGQKFWLSASTQHQIRPKYPDLKYEILNNKMCTIGKITFDSLYYKATEKLKTDMAKEISKGWKHTHGYAAAFCGLICKKISSVKEEHLIAVMLYCNFDTLCNKFRSTFRPETPEEQMSITKMKHSNFYHFGKYLQQMVLLFGKCHDNNKGRVDLKFYHGTQRTFGHTLFSTTMPYVNSPLSTSKEYSVAVSFAGHDGYVLSLWTGIGEHVYFDCQWLSDFMNESEILFLGNAWGWSRLQFSNIFEIMHGFDYHAYVEALTYIYSMNGTPRALYVTSMGNVYKAIVKSAVALLYNELNRYDKQYTKIKSIPLYIERLMHYHCSQIRQFTFDWDYASHEKFENWSYASFAFGHKRIVPFVCDASTQCVKLDLFMKLFPLLQKFTIYKGVLSRELMDYLLSVLRTDYVKQREFFTQIILEDVATQTISSSALISEYFDLFGLEQWVLLIQQTPYLIVSLTKFYL